MISCPPHEYKINADLSVKAIKFLHAATTYAQLKIRELLNSSSNEYAYREKAYSTGFLKVFAFLFCFPALVVK